MVTKGSLCALVAVLLVSWPLDAQQMWSTPSNLRDPWHQRSLFVMQDEVPTKSPFLAGLFSFVIPGTGSFYAHHSGHGLRHLIAIPVIVGGTIAGIALAGQDDGEVEWGEVIVLGVGAGLLVANAIWATVTAVNDAKAFNARTSSARVTIRLKVRRLDPLRTGVSLLQVYF